MNSKINEQSFLATQLHARPWLNALKPYDPGHDLPTLRKKFGDQLVELGSNENAFGINPSALLAAQNALSQMYRYPDPLGADLKQALASKFQLKPSEIFLGNGSHEILMQIGQAFAGPKFNAIESRVVYSQFGFAVFPLAAITHGAIPVAVAAFESDHPSAPRGHDLSAILNAAKNGANIVFLSNPNNPTGTWFEQTELEHLLDLVSPQTIVVMDEAYGEYGDDEDGSVPAASGVNLVHKYSNLIVTRTFSKAYGLAGLRVGYALSQSHNLVVLEKLRESFNVNNIALAAAEAGLRDQVYVSQTLLKTRLLREKLTRGCIHAGVRVLPSRTNFVLLDFEREAAPIEARLLAQGIVVRPMLGYGLQQCLRVTVGSEEDIARFLEVLPVCL